jgi:protein phosphatase
MRRRGDASRAGLVQGKIVRSDEATLAGMDLTQVLEIASCTDPGMVRSHNEDSIAADAASGLAVLADGMGGYNAGEVASGMATTVILSEMRQMLAAAEPYQVDPRTNETIAVRMVREQVLRANRSIYQAAQSHPQYAGMGTTLVVALFYDNRVLVAHLGDSRLYVRREGVLRQVTRDHSLLQEQIDSGLLTVEQAKSAQHKNLVTKALGIDPTVEPEIHEYATRPGDVYLLCSDGLPDMVDDEDISMTLQALGGNLKLAAQQLVQMANDNGGRDNVSVILVRVLREYPGARGVMAKVFAWLK